MNSLHSLTQSNRRVRVTQRSRHAACGFTLVELLVVVSIIAILSALLLPALSRGKAIARRATCISNLKQVNLAVRMFAEDHGEVILMPPRSVPSQYDFHFYKEMVKSYLALKGKPSMNESVFACPADTFSYTGSGRKDAGLHSLRTTDFTSYAFNGMNYRGTNSETGISYPGIAGKRLDLIRQPDRTVLVCEASALMPYSWHAPGKMNGGYRLANSKNQLSFVDGHVSYTRMYWNSAKNSETWHYDPPAQYEYKWSGD